MRLQFGRTMRLSLLAAFAVGLSPLACSGPKQDLPKVHPASGKVVRRDGSSFPGGSIIFNQQTDEKDLRLSVRGDIKPDGTFKLYSLVGSTRLDGAPAGKYKVRVLGSSRSQAQEMFAVRKLLEVVAGKENTFNIKAPRKRRR